MELEEQIEKPVTDPSEILKYEDEDRIYEFQIFPNVGPFKKFDSPLIANYVIFGIYSKKTQEFQKGGRITVKKMKRWIEEKKLVEQKTF